MRYPFESRPTWGPAPLSIVVIAGDPDEDARLILASGLTYAGYRLRLADTGDALLREARGHDVSLVIAEVGLSCAGSGRTSHEPLRSYASGRRARPTSRLHTSTTPRREARSKNARPNARRAE